MFSSPKSYQFLHITLQCTSCHIVLDQYPKRFCKSFHYKPFEAKHPKSQQSSFSHNPWKVLQAPLFSLSSPPPTPQDPTLEAWTSSKWTQSQTSLVKIFFFLDLILAMLKLPSWWLWTWSTLLGFIPITTDHVQFGRMGSRIPWLWICSLIPFTSLYIIGHLQVSFTCLDPGFWLPFHSTVSMSDKFLFSRCPSIGF